MSNERLSVAIVVPRYGREVGGGAERLAREYALRLADRFEVTVLTTCALDYRTWQDHFPVGITIEDGVRVIRFSVPVPRDEAQFTELCHRVFEQDHAGASDEERWMDAQGPNAPDLLAHLASDDPRYDAVMFIPYVYATTVRGLPLVADRAILVPALHDEPSLRLSIFAPILESACALIVSTPEEAELAVTRFAGDPSKMHLVGAGVDPPAASDARLFRDAFGLSRPYVVAVGRVDPSKGAEHLISYHDRLRRHDPDAPDLVLIGPSSMAIPERPWLHATGFLDDALKNSAIAGAVALVCPSPFESLSLVLLEAWSHGIPTVCSATSTVLVGQSRRAGAGIWYRDGDEYAECVGLLHRTPALGRALGVSGRRFAEGLSWSATIERLASAVVDVANAARTSRPDAE